ncbi:MAG: flagella basal body P-ring formation protein FlgA [Actinobacteria bacterium]|nr:flagella basal body P-ring formation protein FlgA [Actinomycetota bacterium]
MRQRIISITFVIISLLGGLFIFFYLKNLEEEKSGNTDYREIFIAKNAISRGETITEDLIEEQKIPKNIFSNKFVTVKTEIIGKKAVQDIPEGEIISKDEIEVTDSDADSYLKFSSYIPYGLRAVSVPVNCYSDPTLLKVGDKVDVVSTYYDEGSNKLEVDTILSEKEIILIDNSLYGDGEDSESIKGSTASGSKAGDEAFLLDTVFSDEPHGGGLTHFFIITFYLNPQEVELVFLSMERGVLYISICPQG